MVKKLSSGTVLQNKGKVELGFECKMKWRNVLVVHFSHDIALILYNYLKYAFQFQEYFFLILDDKFFVN